MKTQSPDTSPEMEKVYFDILRSMPRQQRVQLAIDFIDETNNRQRARIAQSHPEWSEQQVKLHWATLMYGDEVMQGVRKQLEHSEDKT